MSYKRIAELVALFEQEIENGAWRKQALCKPPVKIPFHAPNGNNPGRAGHKAPTWDQPAREMCSECPVGGFDGPCFEQAMTAGEYGIWAGTDEYERMKLRRYDVHGGRPDPCPDTDCNSKYTVHSKKDERIVYCIECRLRWSI